MAHTFANILLHVVFSTKDRAPVLPAAVQPELHRYLGGIGRLVGAPVLHADRTTDHVHLLVQLPTSAAVAEIVGKLKANSSKWLRETHGLATFAWQPGYAVFSVS